MIQTVESLKMKFQSGVHIMSPKSGEEDLVQILLNDGKITSSPQRNFSKTSIRDIKFRTGENSNQRPLRHFIREMCAILGNGNSAEVSEDERAFITQLGRMIDDSIKWEKVTIKNVLLLASILEKEFEPQVQEKEEEYIAA